MMCLALFDTPYEPVSNGTEASPANTYEIHRTAIHISPEMGNKQHRKSVRNAMPHTAFLLMNIMITRYIKGKRRLAPH